MLRTNNKDEGHTMKAQTKMGVSSSEKCPSSNFVFLNSVNFLKEKNFSDNMEKKINKGTFPKNHIPHNKGKRKQLNLLDIYRKHWNENKSILEISKEIGVSDRLIRLRLEENGYNLRKKENPPERIKKKIKNTMKERGIEPKEKYVGEAWNKGKNLNYNVWNKGLKGVQESTKRGKNFEDFYGEKTAETIKEKIREKRAEQVLPLQDSSIEVKIQKYLSNLDINYQAHKFIPEIRHSYQCDIFIPEQEGINKKTIIECDGCYWHGCPECNEELNKKQKKQRDKDNRRTNELKGKGYEVLRLWEHQIRQMSELDFKEALYNE